MHLVGIDRIRLVYFWNLKNPIFVVHPPYVSMRINSIIKTIILIKYNDPKLNKKMINE